MTREEAIPILRQIAGSYGDVKRYYDAMWMAIDALRDIKTGAYIDSETGRLKCSVCGKEFPFVNKIEFQGIVIWETDVLQHMNYCMNCGCKLEGDKQ